jgi:hypothetical protein
LPKSYRLVVDCGRALMTLLRAVALSRNCCTKGSISVVGLKRSLRRLSIVGCLRTVKLLCLRVQLLRPHDLEETQHFSHWPQKKVAKIVGSKYPVVTSGAWRTFPSTAGDRDHCVGRRYWTVLTSLAIAHQRIPSHLYSSVRFGSSPPISLQSI